MFGLSFGELLIICVVALLVLGPQGLPTLARTVGKAVRQFRAATGDLRQAMEGEFYRMDDPPKVTPRPHPEGAIARVEPAADTLHAAGDAAGATPADPGMPVAGTTDAFAAAPRPAPSPEAASAPAPAAPADVPAAGTPTPPAGGRA